MNRILSSYNFNFAEVSLCDVFLIFKIYFMFYIGVWASLVAQTVKNLPAMRETQVHSMGQEEPLEKGIVPAPLFLPEKSRGQRSLAGCVGRD